jgi:hypothetical protein
MGIAALFCACGGSSSDPISQKSNDPPPAIATVLIAVESGGGGGGRILSSPAGLDCPGACTLRVTAGTAVTLTATADESSQFDGFDGLCEGSSCTLTASADATVHATFSVDPCAGLVPKSLPVPKTLQLPQGGEDPTFCATSMSDGAGNVYLASAGFFAPLQSGFTSFTQQMVAEGGFIASAPDFTTISATAVLDDVSAAGLQANGGIVLAQADCRGGLSSVHLRKLDAMGQAESDVPLAGLQCPASFVAVAVDAHDRTIVLSDFPAVTDGAGRTAARWFDASGQPLTEWFDAGPVLDNWFYPGYTGELFPLIGGGVVLRNPRNEWSGSIASGKAELGPQPAGFDRNLDVRIVKGGKAYAFVSGSEIEIVSAGGKSCGTVTVPATPENVVVVGRDGSILETGPREPRASCTVTDYSQALQ